MNWLDSVISSINPQKGVKRAQARRVLAAYEAAKPTVLRKQSKDAGSGDRWVSQAGPNLRNQARHLDANHDLAKGVLNTLVNNIVGAKGFLVEPQPRSVSGEINDELAETLLSLYKDWSKKPECTFTMNWSSAQRMVCRSWIRDGEVLAKSLQGNVPFLKHGTKVRLTLELLESDMLPLTFEDPSKNITQAIQRNVWGEAKQYHFYKNHPGDNTLYGAHSFDLKPVSAQFVYHLRLRDRISQLRGVSVFASVMTRLDDIKDYEESERIAAKIAASMAAYIKKGTPDLYDPENGGDPRNMKFSPGMVFDDLDMGEEIGMIDTNRPNPQLIEFRKGQLKAVSAGTGAGNSTISRTYDGSWSSQRQEQAEGWVAYEVLGDEFVAAFVQPVWEDFVKMAVLDGLVNVPADIDPLTLSDALFIGPSMPTIDRVKEMKGFTLAERSNYMSAPEIIRRGGRNPKDVIESNKRFYEQLKKFGLLSDANPAHDNNGDENADE